MSSGQHLVFVSKDAAEVGGGPEDKQDSRASGLPQARCRSSYQQPRVMKSAFRNVDSLSLVWFPPVGEGPR